MIAELRPAAAPKMRGFFPIPLSASHTVTRFNGLVSLHVQNIAEWGKIAIKLFVGNASRNHNTDGRTRGLRCWGRCVASLPPLPRRCRRWINPQTLLGLSRFLLQTFENTIPQRILPIPPAPVAEPAMSRGCPSPRLLLTSSRAPRSGVSRVGHQLWPTVDRPRAHWLGNSPPPVCHSQEARTRGLSRCGVIPCPVHHRAVLERAFWLLV